MTKRNKEGITPKQFGFGLLAVVVLGTGLYFMDKSGNGNNDGLDKGHKAAEVIPVDSSKYFPTETPTSSVAVTPAVDQH
jgi:hypothetical protein